MIKNHERDKLGVRIMGRSTLERVSRQGLLEVLDLWAERPEAILRDLNFIFFVAEEAFESLKLNEITFFDMFWKIQKGREWIWTGRDFQVESCQGPGKR